MSISKFISVHVPKAAGTSFLNLLKKTYGGNVKTDYLDIMNLNAVILHNVPTSFKYPPKIHKRMIISGHFKASKYLHLKRPFVTWVRNPVDRAISHYYYWKKLWLKPKKRNWDEKLSKLFESGMDLVQFSEIFSNQMSYFLDVDLKRFVFIGVAEYYNESIKWLGKILDKDIPIGNKKLNVGNKHKISADIRSKIANNHKKDFELYNYALEIFLNKTKKIS